MTDSLSGHLIIYSLHIQFIHQNHSDREYRNGHNDAHYTGKGGHYQLGNDGEGWWKVNDLFLNDGRDDIADQRLHYDIDQGDDDGGIRADG